MNMPSAFLRHRLARTAFYLLVIVLSGIFGVFNYSLAVTHPAGTNIVSNGTIYMVTDDLYRRPYTSAGAFLSYGFNSWVNIVPASTEDMALPEGSFIPPRDGKIVCSDRGDDKGTCYLITNGKRAAFVSEKIFKDLGFSFAKAIYGDVSFLDKDADVAGSTEQHRPGVLINKNGTIYLVASDGLLGIPSLDLLKTWGYSLGDAVVINSADAILSETSTMSARQGAQLLPSGATTKINESSILQGYVDTYPDLPIKTIVAPEDGALVIDLIKKIEAMSGPKLDPAYPYLTSQSLSLMKRIPQTKNYFESPFVHLPYMQMLTSNVQIFEGGTTALYTESQKQDSTNYTWTYSWVCKKENGVWKWDFIGSIKYHDKMLVQRNPGQLYTDGNGVNDISIYASKYLAGAAVGDPNTYLYVQLQNKGATTIKKFDLQVRLNNTIVIDETDGYELLPGKSIILSIPIGYYWQVPNVNKNPGRYTTLIKVGFDYYTKDFNLDDNSYTLVSVFDPKSASDVGNIVGN